MPAARPDPTAQGTFYADRAHGGIWVVTVIGDVDLADHDRFQAAVDRALQASPAKLVFDLAGVRFMDSFGLRIMITATHSPAAVELRNPSPVIRRLIDITGLATVLTVTE